MGVIADGARTLAMLWTSAWADGDGDGRVAEEAIVAATEPALKTLYEDPDFVRSVSLNEIADHLGLN